MADAALQLRPSAPDRGDPPGRRERNKAANRQIILDAAREVFGELGYEAATVRDIVRRTGLSVGAFYNYFRSREEVFEALSDDGARRFQPLLRAAYERSESFEQYLQSAIAAYYQFLVFEQDAWQTKRPAGEPGPHVRVETPEMLAVFDEVERSFRDVIERGLAPRVDAEYLAAAAIAVAREVGAKMLERRPVVIEPAVTFAVQLILGGLAVLPRLDASNGKEDRA